MSTVVKRQPTASERAASELQGILMGARTNAARLDAAALDGVMRTLESWMVETTPLLSRDRGLREAAVKGLAELRDLCSVLTSAIRDGLAAASTDNTPRGYGPARYNVGAATPVLTRRYG